MDKDETYIQTPALGRPFRLGMLYDRRKDVTIPGETLWTNKDLHDYTIYAEQPGCDFEVIYGDTLEDKNALFEADANLKLNFLKGTINLGSSGKYLKDTKSTENKVRVSLRCNYFTHYNELSFPSKITNTNTYLKTDATHIVAAIKYGAHVVFVFERTVASSDDKLEIEGELKGMIDKIPATSIEGSANITKTETEKRTEDSVSCKYYGDIILPSNPTSFQDAVDAYKTLPNYVNKEQSAPVTVWLYPLCKLGTKECKIIRIDLLNLKKIEEICENLQSIQITCNDLLSTDACMHLPDVRNRITIFKDHVRTYQQVFQSKVTEIHNHEPSTNEKLASILSMHAISPFGISTLKEWIALQKAEIKILNSIVNKLEKDIDDDADLTVKLIENDDVICLNISIPLSENVILSNMKTCIDMLSAGHSSGNSDTNPHPRSTLDGVWFREKNILSAIRGNFDCFNDLKKEMTDVTFAAMISNAKSCDANSCVILSYYKKGIKKKDNITSDHKHELHKLINEEDQESRQLDQESQQSQSSDEETNGSLSD